MRTVTMCCEKCGHFQKQSIPNPEDQTAGQWEANKPIPAPPPCGDMGVTDGEDEQC